MGRSDAGDMNFLMDAGHGAVSHFVTVARLHNHTLLPPAIGRPLLSSQDFQNRKQLAFELLRAELRFADAQGRPSRYSHLLLHLLSGVLTSHPAAAASAAAAALVVPGSGAAAGAPPLQGADAAVDIVTNCPIVLPEVIRILKE
jgi:hypothetical protein